MKILDNELVHLKSDSHCVDMAMWVPGVRTLHVYVTHPTKKYVYSLLLGEIYAEIRKMWPKFILREIDDIEATRIENIGLPVLQWRQIENDKSFEDGENLEIGENLENRANEAELEIGENLENMANEAEVENLNEVVNLDEVENMENEPVDDTGIDFECGGGNEDKTLEVLGPLPGDTQIDEEEDVFETSDHLNELSSIDDRDETTSRKKKKKKVEKNERPVL
ncbi:hypothetical protein LIER_24239 [Lithospermum erythrorhizon]|uniref:Uncharacterized protein n=1 Tax=Lithospermum erythrorhizon TaxID=34254 RepID=A0AAV3R0C2_LITER